MNLPDLLPLLPVLVLAAAALVVLLEIAFFRDYRATALLALLGFALCPTLSP